MNKGVAFRDTLNFFSVFLILLLYFIYNIAIFFSL